MTGGPDQIPWVVLEAEKEKGIGRLPGLNQVGKPGPEGMAGGCGNQPSKVRKALIPPYVGQALIRTAGTLNNSQVTGGKRR